MKKEIIIGACIAGILGTLDILTTDILKYGAVALLGVTAFMTFSELNPPKKQGQFQRPMQEERKVRQKAKVIWDEFPKESCNKEVKPKEPTFKVEDTNVQEQNQIQNPEEVPKAG